MSPEINKTSQVLESVCLFVSRPNIRQVIKQIVKEMGTQEILIPEDVDECISQLRTNEQIPLILDWEHGPAEVSRVLGESQAPEGTNLREIYLIATEVNNEIVISAAEYNVSRVSVGEISKNTIVQDLNFIAYRMISNSPPKKCLMDVALCRKVGDHLGAVNCLKETLSNDPENTRLNLELAQSLTSLQAWDEAEKITSDLLARDPSNLRAMHIYGRCMMKVGKFTEAVKAYEAAAAMNKMKQDRLVEFGHLLMQTGKHKDALKQFDLALTIDDTDKDAMVGKGQCKLMLGDVNDGLEILRDIMDGPELAAIFNASAILSIKQSKFEDGINLYRSALGAVGKSAVLSARLHFNMGLAYYKESNLQEALKCFVAAQNADPTFNSAAVNTRILSSKTGQHPPSNKSRSTPPQSHTHQTSTVNPDDEFVSDFHSNIEDETKT